MRFLNSNRREAQHLMWWRWIFIVVQSAVFVTFSIECIYAFGFGISAEAQDQTADFALRFSYIAGLFFLLVGSPFFFKSLGELAVIGWIGAIGILLITGCFPATPAR